MFEIEKYTRPATISEAYEILEQESRSVVLGGCGYLGLGSRKIPLAIDLSLLGLDKIEDCEDHIQIGAMTILREIEVNRFTSQLWSGALASSVSNIVGVQFRNVATIGGSVAGRYAFSDPITILLALDADVVFHKSGKIKLAEFISGSPVKDILTHIVIPKVNRAASFISVRRNSTDYPMLNCAVSRVNADYKIVVGSRPGKAALASAAAKYLSENGLTDETVTEACEIATSELRFGDNPRASKEYRKQVCPVLIKRALLTLTEGETHAG